MITKIFFKSMKNLDQRQLLLASYKLLHDLSFILLVFFAGLLIAEGILPGFLSSHINIPLLVLLMLIALGLIGKISRNLDINYPPVSIRKNKSIPFLITIIILLLGSSMLKLSLWMNLLIVLGILYLLFLFYRMILKVEL